MRVLYEGNGVGRKIEWALKYYFLLNLSLQKSIFIHTAFHLECSLESLKQTLLYIHYDSRSIMCWCTEQKEPEISLLFSFTVQSTEKRTKRKEIKHKETISSPVCKASILLNTWKPVCKIVELPLLKAVTELEKKHQGCYAFTYTNNQNSL